MSLDRGVKCKPTVYQQGKLARIVLERLVNGCYYPGQAREEPYRDKCVIHAWTHVAR